MSLFATTYIEPGSGDVAFLLSSSIDQADHHTVIKMDNTVLIHDPIMQRSLYASSHIGIAASSIICCHASHCRGKACICVEVSMQLAACHGRQTDCCPAALAANLAAIPGQFTIIKTSEDTVTMVSTPESPQAGQGGPPSSQASPSPVFRHLPAGKHFFFMKDWCFRYEEASVSTQHLSDIPVGLKDLGNRWLRGADSAVITSAITSSLQQNKQGKRASDGIAATCAASPSRVSPDNIAAFALEADAVNYNYSLSATFGTVPASPGLTLLAAAAVNSRSTEASAVADTQSRPLHRGSHCISLLRATNIATLWYQSPVKVLAPVTGPTGPTPQVCLPAASLLDVDVDVDQAEPTTQTRCPRSPMSAYSKQNVSDMKPPKGYICAFNFYVRNARHDVLLVNPQLEYNNNELNKELGLLWRGLSKAGRSPYAAMAERDKERYRSELGAFNAAMSESGNGHRVIIPRVNNKKKGAAGCPVSRCGTGTVTAVEPWAGAGSTTTTTVSGAIEEPEQIYRPRTAYSHFSRQEKQFVSALSSGSKMQLVTGKFFSARWSFMSPEQKRLYSLLESDDRHEAQALHMSKRTRVE